jgi:hypothetical protein
MYVELAVFHSASFQYIRAGIITDFGQFNHVRFTRNGTQIHGFLNGVYGDSYTIGADPVPAATVGNALRVANSVTVNSTPEGNYYDAIRYVVGTALNTGTANFTPPASGYGFLENVPAELDNTARAIVSLNGTPIGTRREVNLIEGTNVTLTVADDSGNERVDVTVNSSGPAAAITVSDEGSVLTTALASFDFVGAGVTATNSAGAVTVSIPGGGGGVSDGDKGDITVSSSGAVWTIDNSAVTYAKLQNISATARLLGRATAGAGVVEEITIGSGLSLTGTTLSAPGGGISDGDKGDITVSSSGTVWTVDNNAVTYAKLQNVSATSRLLGRATAGAGIVEEITIGSGLSLAGTTLSAAGGGSITVQDEGSTLTTSLTSLDFVGAGVTATNTVGAVTVTIPGGSGAGLALALLTASGTVAANTRNLCDTSGGPINALLPASPSEGDEVQFADAINTSLLTGFGVFALTIQANTGHTIQGATNLVLDRGGQAIHLVFRSNRWSIVGGIGENSTPNLLADIQAMIATGN